MSDNKGRWLVCIRVIPGHLPKLASWQETCYECDCKVWRSDTIEVDYVVCIQCAQRIINHDKNAVVTPPTLEQLQKIRDHYKTGQN
jgi:hypothetical protein